MTARPPTQAAIRRAIRAARKEGCAAVVLWGGAVTIPLDASALPPLTSPERDERDEGDEAQCDRVFGLSD